MASPQLHAQDADGLDGDHGHGLALDRIAVGPYCVFDAFRPPSSPRPTLPSAQPAPQTAPNAANDDQKPTRDNMDDSDFPFAPPPRPSWMTTAPDDMPLAAPSWSDFMAWDPNLSSSQGPDLKLSGPACMLRPELQRPGAPQAHASQPGLPAAGQPTANADANAHANPIPHGHRAADTHPQTHPSHQHHHHQHQHAQQPADPPASIAMPGSAHAAFSFGDNPQMPPAFDFDPAALSSPPGDANHQHASFYPTHMWPQHMPDAALFSPPTFDTTALPSASVPPLSNPPSLHHSHSPNSIQNARISSSSEHSTPEPSPGSSNPKKRKSSTDDEDSSAKGSGKDKQQPPKKTAHNMIEKRYRTNLNDKIAALRDSVPSLRVMSRGNGQGEEEDDPEDLEGLTPAHKLNKATVLSKATEYIRHLEKRNKHLQDEVTTLKGRLESYEKMAISGPMTLHGPLGTPDSGRYTEDPFASSHHMPMAGPPQGMIPVPDHIAGLRQGLPPQQHYAPAYPPYAGQSRPGHNGPMVNSRRSNSMMGKLMVGSLAGLMILEGLVEREKSRDEPEGRGLFALPINFAAILAPRVSLGATSTQLPLVKVLLILGAVFFVVGPMFDFSSKQKKKTADIILARAPSLASPVEVRQRAWLTAIQTVWVPRHNFLLEAAALSLKTLKLSMRKIIGWPGYAFLSGTTKEQEAARIKAWSIALDAQLTGGDAEISKSRLVLTLMASGTLPDTPAQLMLKALHLRVLLWELANAGHGLSWVLDTMSAKLSRRYWNMARTEHRIATNLNAKSETDAEKLPNHLAALLDKECDEVLNPSIIQRAYNLAWNRPVAEQTTADPCMDGVVTDSGISSPLDALAAWYSSFVLRESLVESLNTTGAEVSDTTKEKLDLATRTAPPTSHAHLRSLVAQAVVLPDNTTARLAAAVAALPAPTSTNFPSSKKLINLVSSAPAAIDVRKALTLAKCLDLAVSNHPDARRQAVFVVNNTYVSESAMTLLSFVAGFKLLDAFVEDLTLLRDTSFGLERLAGALRMWVGRGTGRRCGLDDKMRSKIVSRCLSASKTLVGLAERSAEDEEDTEADADADGDADQGYFSESVKGGESVKGDEQIVVAVEA